MATIPARLAQRSIVSSSLSESRARSRALYRDFYRSAPEICTLYALDVPPSTLRAKIRTKFEERRHITDMSVLDVLLHKARVDYQETMNAWKQTPHVMKMFAAEEAQPMPETFLEKFYASKDEGRGTIFQGN
ncbi:NADH dehydrogenase, alpha subcomplex, subunit 6 [Jaminaea rosea]|uniref:NADH dehydrogenase, alpha subcomplex, subunit 6 n=1 Tax=Jaminaea rosea TaxID=1569628 RepID=A0A316UM24_9BASI|nr:NADH dehydrogenase, alpha subcomplex, subunit 6 [Jaminaea rosea]PWN26307.1 NADH dehydrogenase, alpha subcomplex, subunit 6 [Jaminaea rosea]